MLSGSELFTAKEIIILLKPFDAATKELCGQDYVTGSKIIPLIHYLVKKIERILVSSVIASDFKSSLTKNVTARFG